MQNLKITTKILALALCCGSSLVYAYSAHSNQLFLSVQENGRPLFKTIQLTIYKITKHKYRQIVYRSQRHTLALALSPGQYEVSAMHNNHEVRQPFNVLPYEPHYLTLNLNQTLK